MKKIIKLIVCLFLIISVVFLTDVWRDKKVLQEKLIRLHVIANSDSSEDQAIKLQVRDAVVNYLQPVVEKFSDKEQAMAFIEEKLPVIQLVVNNTLSDLGVNNRASVSLRKEAYGTRNYDTFFLPAGIYDSLRIQIGDGEGKNWWCVVFPSLCLPATTDGFQDKAVASGFTEELGNSLSNGRNLRFFILDFYGRLEKLFY